jgi:hypothetical protein
VEEAREQTIWMSMFQKFVGYKEQHKDTKVPKQDPKLTRWVSKQRIRYKNNELLPKRLALLNSIGFKWNRKGEFEQLWMGMFQKLITYKNLHKDTKVPTEYDEDPKLGNWVSLQRKFYKNDRLYSKRLALLKRRQVSV